ncbi:hypothetical protein Hanom_Chr17g01558561 [Helianthus anomalus]
MNDDGDNSEDESDGLSDNNGAVNQMEDDIEDGEIRSEGPKFDDRNDNEKSPENVRSPVTNQLEENQLPLGDVEETVHVSMHGNDFVGSSNGVDVGVYSLHGESNTEHRDSKKGHADVSGTEKVDFVKNGARLILQMVIF